MKIQILFCEIIFIACTQLLQCLPILPGDTEYSDSIVLANGNAGQKSSELNVDRGAASRKHKTVRMKGLQQKIKRYPEIAFQATLTRLAETVEVKEAIKFNHVITNIGGAYDSNTGIFTAPVSGLYNFNTNIVAEKGYYVEASIVVNGEATVSAVSDHRLLPQDLWDQGHAMALLSLNRGDKVAVSVLWPSGTHIIHGAGKTSFSGYLIRSHEKFGKYLKKLRKGIIVDI